MAQPDHLKFAVLVSANAEWAAVKSAFGGLAIEHSPYGEYFVERVGDKRALFFYGGLGKVAAAASTQYGIDHFHPACLINIGACVGVEVRIDPFDVLFPDKLGFDDIYVPMIVNTA